MRRVLLVQPSIEPPGGGNAVACWMIEALKPDHAVTLLTYAPPDLEKVNRTFGTALVPADLRVEVAAPPSRLLRAAPVPLTLARGHALLAEARRLAGAHDVSITANNEGDLGRRGIQYIHFPKFYFPRPDADLRWYHRSAAAVRAYYRLCALATGFSLERMRANVTLVNSDWTGGMVRGLHGIEPRTLYPPAAGAPGETPWEARTDGFICVGRISPEKRLEAVVAILARVRRARPALTLTIAGSADDPGYRARIEALAARHADWVRLEVDVPRERLLGLLGAHRYGIHGMLHEHFGMAVAELVRAGCIVFAPKGGGQVEALDREPRLLYESDDDAVEKISRALGDPALARDLRERLAPLRDRFSSARFVREVRAVVAEL